MPFLELSDITFRYAGSGRPTLDHLSLTVAEGETVALVGPNGAGKSTLARVVKGLLACESGRAVLEGAPVGGSGHPDPRVGLLFSNPENQMVTSVVEEDLAFGLEAQALPPAVIRARVEEVVARFALQRLRRALPHRLSGGEQQRVALAGVVAPRPRLLVLDEPSAFLDPAGRSMVNEALRSLRGEGTTILLVTHEMEEAARADRVVLLREGRVEGEGSPAAFFSSPSLASAGGLVRPFGSLLRARLEERGVSGPDTALWEDVVEALPPGPGFPSSPPPPPPPSAPLTGGVLSASGLSFSYGKGRPVLDGCSLSLSAGQIALLVGPNGSGKSTLLTLLAGLVPPDEGEVRFRGAPLARAPRGRRSLPVAMAFQNPERQLFGETAGEDISFGPGNLGAGREEAARRAMEAAERMGLDRALLALPPFHLSGGQQRRAALAGVLALRPEVLLLDEPTDGLDPAGARALQNSLRDLSRETGTSVLVAGHAVPDLVGLFDRVLVLNGGEVTSAGGPREALAAVPEAFLPPHLAAQRAVARRGYPLREVWLGIEEAAEAIAEAVMELGPSLISSGPPGVRK